MSERDPPSGAERLGVVIVEEHPARRLGRAAALSARWRVLALESAETLSRVQRAERPALVLLSVDPAHPGAATRAAQRAKTDLSHRSASAPPKPAQEPPSRRGRLAGR